MTQQIINVGPAPNDGLGDPIRTAFIKTNTNFSQLYSRAQTSPPPTPTGSVGDQAGMYAYDSTYFYYCFANYTGNTTIWNQIEQAGNISATQILNGTSSIEIASANANATVSIAGTPNVAVFNTAGIVVSGIVSASGNVRGGNVNTGGIVSAGGNIVGNYILGNGSQLTGLPATYSNSNVALFLNAFGSNTISTTGTITAGNITGANISTNGTISSQGTITTQGALSATGDIITTGMFIGTFQGNVTGNFVVPGSNTQVIFNTNGNADATAGMTYNKDSNTFAVMGTISSQDNTVAGNVSAGGNIFGNIVLPTSGRLFGDFGNINRTNRPFVQSSDPVLPTILGVLPGANYTGTGTTQLTALSAYANADPNNSSIGILQITPTDVRIRSSTSGTGTLLPLTFVMYNTEYMRVATSGNVGIGNTTPNNTLAVTGTTYVSGNTTAGNLLTGGQVSATGNVSGSYLKSINDVNVGGNISTTNLTGTGVSVVSNITGGNLLTGGLVSATGNITGNYFIGNGSQLTGLPVTYSNSNVVSLLAAFGSNTISTTGTINSGNITGGNILTDGLISAVGTITGNSIMGTVVSATGNITGGNLVTGGSISSTANIIGGNLSVGTGTITVNNIVNGGSNATGNIGSSSTYFNTVFATATTALYADLAECYLADDNYAPGTVLSFGGNNEVTTSTADADPLIVGVVSTNPAYKMNSGLTGDHVVAVALTGRVPCRVEGPVTRGAMMVSAGNGRARAEAKPAMGTVIGKAVESFSGDIGTIEIVVGRL
jgi:hypothetical protein